jgi:kynurenine 3-monooxygenase
MNSGFEDCAVFNKCLSETTASLDNTAHLVELFERFQNLRKENADAIATMALENFIEMRDKVADPHFLLTKKVEHLLGNHFPGVFLSRYEYVSFTRTSYKKVYEIGLTNDRITSELLAGIDVDHIKPEQVTQLIDLGKAKELIDRYLVPLLKDK